MVCVFSDLNIGLIFSRPY